MLFRVSPGCSQISASWQRVVITVKELPSALSSLLSGITFFSFGVGVFKGRGAAGRNTELCHVCVLGEGMKGWNCFTISEARLIQTPFKHFPPISEAVGLPSKKAAGSYSATRTLTRIKRDCPGHSEHSLFLSMSPPSWPSPHPMDSHHF